MAIATLRIMHPSITADRMVKYYRRTFVCRHYRRHYPQKFGQDDGRRKAFYQQRAASIIASHHIAIDGTLKQDSNTGNDLSAFSYKVRKKGGQEVSVLYAYDIEITEPICAEAFPGNSIDTSFYAAFIRDNDICRGILVSDKVFPPARSKRNWRNVLTCASLCQ